ncbi:hypothetical protein AAZX31_02G205700 [Glycine max]
MADPHRTTLSDLGFQSRKVALWVFKVAFGGGGKSAGGSGRGCWRYQRGKERKEKNVLIKMMHNNDA